MTFWETVERGEYVMIALAVICILIMCIWCVRGIKLRKERSGYPDLMHRLRDLMTEGDVENANQLCHATPSAGARIIGAGLDRLGNAMPEIRAAMDTETEIESMNMENGLRWLRALAVISPLLGLGGTLVGVIDRLRDLGRMGETVDLGILSGNIAPTIVTAVAGLGVGIFALVACTALEAAIRISKLKLKELAAEFVRLLNEPT